jgi:hypothetical protein
MTLTERIDKVRQQRKRQLMAASLLTLATAGTAVSAVLIHSALSIIASAVVAACTLLQWTLFVAFQVKEEVYTVMRDRQGASRE